MEKQEKEEGGGEGVEEVRLQQGRFNIGIKAGARSSPDSFILKAVLWIRDILVRYGSGSTDPCLWPMDPAPDPAFFVLDLQDASKKH